MKAKRRDTPGQLLIDFGMERLRPVPAPPAASTPKPAFVISHPPNGTVAEPLFANLIATLKRIGPEGESEASEQDENILRAPPLEREIPPETLPAELQRLAQADTDGRESDEFITDARCIELVRQAVSEIRPNEIRDVRVRFFPFRSTLYSFRLDRQKRARIKMHVAFRKAGATAMLQAARLMLSKSRAQRQKLERAEYDRFVRSIPTSDFKLPGARKATRMALAPQGVHRHLEDSFQRVNTAYFSGQLKQPELCWSPVKARRILGSYQERHDRLIVSRVFDNPSVPEFVLDFLMYHELLHKFLGIGRHEDGRRCIHPPEFKKLEKRFDRYGEAQEFLKRL